MTIWKETKFYLLKAIRDVWRKRNLKNRTAER